MKIGQAAKASGVPAKMIRYYEHIGLVPPAGRLNSGYRDYGTADVQRLRLIRTARHFGYSLKRVGELLHLWSDRNRSRSQVKAIALAHLTELETRAAELADMVKSLRQLVRNCDGRRRPESPSITRRAMQPAHSVRAPKR